MCNSTYVSAILGLEKGIAPLNEGIGPYPAIADVRKLMASIAQHMKRPRPNLLLLLFLGNGFVWSRYEEMEESTSEYMCAFMDEKQKYIDEIYQNNERWLGEKSE